LFEFSFEEVVEGLESLDGRERCGLHFQLGESEDGGKIRLAREMFCIGGGEPQRYICHIYTANGPLWLKTPNGDPEAIFEVFYDCGCDVECGIFPGTFLISLGELIEAARCFFQTGQPTDKLPWIEEECMGFDPWIRD
jgi:hypothetical protein